MKLNLEFKSLDEVRKAIGAPLLQLTELSIEKTTLEILRSDDGVEVEFSKDITIDTNGALIHNETGKPVLLYIRDVYGSMPKYHIASCSTIRGYRANGRIERYVAAYRDKENPSTRFRVNYLNWDGTSRSTLKKLDVCKNCLSQLDYKGYSTYGRADKWRIYETFDISEFFESYDTAQITFKPSREESDNKIDVYPKNWKDIRVNYLIKVNCRCENCSIDLSGNPRFLHVHHRNGFKGDNREVNLKALCLKCHSEQPQHMHMRKLPDYKQFLRLYGK